MYLPNNELTFYCKVEGEKTKEQFCGDFTVKCILNQAEQIEAALRTDRYNAGSKTIAPQYAIINRSIAELEMRIVKAPSWWKESDYGRLLYDTNVLFHVFSEAIKGEEEFGKRIMAKAEAAEKDSKPVEKTK